MALISPDYEPLASESSRQDLTAFSAASNGCSSVLYKSCHFPCYCDERQTVNAATEESKTLGRGVAQIGNLSGKHIDLDQEVRTHDSRLWL